MKKLVVVFLALFVFVGCARIVVQKTDRCISICFEPYKSGEEQKKIHK